MSQASGGKDGPNEIKGALPLAGSGFVHLKALLKVSWRNRGSSDTPWKEIAVVSLIWKKLVCCPVQFKGFMDALKMCVIMRCELVMLSSLYNGPFSCSPRMKTAFFIFDLAETASVTAEMKSQLYTLAYTVSHVFCYECSLQSSSFFIVFNFLTTWEYHGVSI